MKKWLCLAMVAAMAALGAGCAKQKLLTPEEIAAERERQLNMIARTYNGVTPQDALLAADRVFRLADEDYHVSGSLFQRRSVRRNSSKFTALGKGDPNRICPEIRKS